MCVYVHVNVYEVRTVKTKTITNYKRVKNA